MVADGEALNAALTLAQDLCKFPQGCLRSDRISVYEQWDMSQEQALANEFVHGIDVIKSRETVTGATRFASGKGRHGNFEEI